VVHSLQLAGRLLRQAVTKPLPQSVAEHADLAQRLLEIMGGDKGELLELGVRASELTGPLLGGGGALGDSLLESRIHRGELAVRRGDLRPAHERAPEEQEADGPGKAEGSEHAEQEPSPR